jgi:hypothetical protein
MLKIDFASVKQAIGPTKEVVGQLSKVCKISVIEKFVFSLLLEVTLQSET